MKNILAQLRWPIVRTRGTAPIETLPETPSDPRLRQHAALVYLSRRALRDPASTSLLGDVCRIAARVLNVDHVNVLELLPDRRTLIARAAAGWPPERLALWHMDVAPESRLGQALRTGGIVVLNGSTEAGTGSPGADILYELRMQSGLAAGLAPLNDARGLFGVYAAKPRRFTRDDLQFVRAVAQIVESALQREAEKVTDRAARASSSASQADLLRVVVGRLRPALKESVGYLWQFRTQPADGFGFRRAVRQTERQVATVADFIEDLSLLADLLSGDAPERRSVLLAPILASLVDQLTARAEQNEVALRLHMVDDLIATAGDGALLRRAFFNLIDNALRFTDPGGTVVISVTSPDPAAARVEIADSGRGMTPTQLARLSKNQDGAIDSEHRGPGLGWRLAAAIIQAHGGTLQASSTGPNRGSVIAAEVPRLNLGDFNLPNSAE